VKNKKKETITLKNGRTVYKEDYLVAKTKDLQDFGYSLELKETRKQFSLFQQGKKLSIIGEFIKNDFE